MERMVRMVH
jgi:hypothetical protein